MMTMHFRMIAALQELLAMQDKDSHKLGLEQLQQTWTKYTDVKGTMLNTDDVYFFVSL